MWICRTFSAVDNKIRKPAKVHGNITRTNASKRSSVLMSVPIRHKFLWLAALTFTRWNVCDDVEIIRNTLTAQRIHRGACQCFRWKKLLELQWIQRRHAQLITCGVSSDICHNICFLHKQKCVSFWETCPHTLYTKCSRYWWLRFFLTNKIRLTSYLGDRRLQICHKYCYIIARKR